MTNQQGAPEALRRTQYLTVVYRDINPGDEARELIMHPKITAASWSHAMNERDRLAALVEAQQPAPSAAAATEVENLRKALQFYADKDHFTIADEGAWDTVSGEPQNYWCDEEGTATVEDGTIARLALAGHQIKVEADEAPQPSHTPQADSQPAPQGETNAQLDIDSNSSAPGQQRDVAGSVALGQPVGNGSDQAAGHTGAQGDKLLIVAERNIRSFLRSAVFKSESDREAALNCVDVLWEAARAPADSVTAPAGGAVADPGWRLVPVEPTPEMLRAGDQKTWVLPALDCWRAMLAAAPTPPAQAADSVLEDAARYRWLREKPGTDLRYGSEQYTRVCAVCQNYGEDLDAAIDAARKQGANHD